MTADEWIEDRAQLMRVAWRMHLGDPRNQIPAMQKVAQEGPADFTARVGGMATREQGITMWTRLNEISSDPIPGEPPLPERITLDFLMGGLGRGTVAAQTHAEMLAETEASLARLTPEEQASVKADTEAWLERVARIDAQAALSSETPEALP